MFYSLREAKMHINKPKQKINTLNAAIAAALLIPAGYSASVVAQENVLEEITVTGSRIVRRDFEANSPIVTVESEFFDTMSDIGIESALNQLPQFIPAATQFDSLDYVPTATNTPGASTLSLRGLASNRNLILFDGRRMMPVNASMAIDINSIPSAAVQRVETITGGASSVYGADAVAGVVNFILKKDFEGATIDVQYGESQEGDGAETRISALMGANFDDGRGNVMFGGEYSDRQKVMVGDRDFYLKGWLDPTVPGDELFFLNTYISDGFGGVTNPFDQAAVDSIFSQAPAGSVDRSANFFLNPSDNQTIYTGGAIFGAGEPDGAYRYNSGFVSDIDGRPFRKIDTQGLINENQTYKMLSIPLERYSLFGRGNYEFSDNASGWIQGTFAQSETFTSWQWTPMIGTNWGAFIPHGSGIYAPSLATDGITTLSAFQPGGIYGLNCAPTGGCTDSQAFPVPAEYATLLDSRDDPNGDFIIQKTVDYMAPRSLINASRTFQLSFGLQGDIEAIDGSWDFSASHGNSFSTVNYLGYMSLARYRAIASAPNFGKGFQRQGNPEAGGFSSGTGFCTSGIPFFFDKSEMSEDCKHTMRVDMMNIANLNQDIAELNLQGKAFDLPAGEVRFAAGTAWRRNDVAFNVDPLSSQSSFTDLPAGNFPTDNTSGSIAVKEVYGELLVPVINDVPFVQELNLELGYRLSDYDNLKDKIDTWKVLGDWVINDSLRVRGGFQVANRAANIGELYQGATQSFVFGPGDTCGLNSIRPVSANPAASPMAAEVEALCRVLMTPDGANSFYDSGNNQPDGFFAGIFSNEVGNPNLQSEEAETKTFGLVYQSNSTSPWLAPLSFTADWYEIEINDMIVVEAPVAVYDACLSTVSNPSRDPNHPACARLLRDPNFGNQLATDVSFNNDGWTKTSGVDFQFNWNSALADVGIDIPGSLGLNVMATVLLDFDTRSSPAANVVSWKGSLGPGPETGLNGGAYDYRLFTTFNYSLNDFAVSLRWRHLPEAVSLAEASNPNVAVPQHGAEDAYNVFDLSGSWAFNDTYVVRFGVDNLFNEEPVITGRVDASGTTPATSGQGTTSPAFYDSLGRRFFFGVKASF
jgi:outer membrane receptor protein involved in Fe transport